MNDTSLYECTSATDAQLRTFFELLIDDMKRLSRHFNQHSFGERFINIDDEGDGVYLLSVGYITNNVGEMMNDLHEIFGDMRDQEVWIKVFRWIKNDIDSVESIQEYCRKKGLHFATHFPGLS